MRSVRHRIAYLQLAYFSKPASDRALYRAIHRHRCQRILEIGVGSGRRASACSRSPRATTRKRICFTPGSTNSKLGRRACPGLSLKEAHRQFKARSSRPSSYLATPMRSLMRAANALRKIDLVVISADQKPLLSRRLGFIYRGCLHATSVVYQEQAGAEGTPVLVALDRATIDARAQKPHRRSVA